RLARTGIALDEGIKRTADGIELALSDSEISRVRASGFHLQILQSDLEAYYASRLKNASTQALSPGSMGGFYTFDEVVQKLKAYRKKFPSLVSAPIEIGKSIEGRSIYAVKISDHVQKEEADEPEVLYTALHHAREPQSLMCVMYFMDRLLQG